MTVPTDKIMMTMHRHFPSPTKNKDVNERSEMINGISPRKINDDPEIE